MGTMDGILRQELIRLKEAEKSYVREIKKLPKGSFQRKRIKGADYVYLVFRKGSKIVSRYLDHLAGEDMKKLKAEIELRKKYQRLLKEVRQNMKRISKVLHGRRRTI